MGLYHARGRSVRVSRTAARLREDVVAMVVDALLVTLTAGLATSLLWSEGFINQKLAVTYAPLLPVAVLSVVAANARRGLYSQVWRHASIIEARRHVEAAATGFALVFLVAQLYDDVPTVLILVSGVLYTSAAGVVRFQNRLLARRRVESSERARVLLVGAGESAAALIRDMSASSSDLYPVGLIDDRDALQQRKVRSVQVQGRIKDLATVARRLRADQVVLAEPAADQDLVRRVAAETEKAGLPLRVLPPISELVGRRATLRDVRDMDIQDLLGRAQVSTDLAAVRQLLQGRVVLVTGAGGSIGSEIARQVAGFSPAKLLLLDHDETHLFDVATRMTFPVEQVLADVRDTAVINGVFAQWRPEVVFHAAAHKHVPLLESHPAEAVRTNVAGTDAVVRAAVRCHTRHFVFISTDKAVRPSSVMGASKRIGEQIVLSSEPAHGAFCAVRFGNVLGSRGSVVPTFLDQIRRGGPVTITDGRMTRYFMSIPEAVQLVLQAAALSTGGEVFMLDMGQPVNIRQMAERLVRLSGLQPGTDIEIRVTGVRPGEKIHEELHEERETPQPTAHPSIMRLRPGRLPVTTVRRTVAALSVLAEHGRTEDLRRLLMDIAHERHQDHDRADGLLSIAHRRRLSDRLTAAVPLVMDHPGRRLDDLVILPDPRTPAEAWTSSTT